MNGGFEGVEKAIVGVWSKINHDLRLGRNRSGHLDVEHYLSIGSAGIASGRIVRAGNGDRRDTGLGNPERSEVILQILRAIASAQFDDGNALTGTVHISRKVVEPCDFDRSESVRPGRV